MLGEFPCLLPCLCGYREGVASVALHIYPPPQPAKNPTITGFSSPPGRPMRDEGFWEGACSFI